MNNKNMNDTVVETKRRVGRPKMTDEQKAAAKAAREQKKGLVTTAKEEKIQSTSESEVIKQHRQTRNPRIANTNITSSDKDMASSVLNEEGKLALENIMKLSKNQTLLTGNCTRDEARFLVDSYYQIQQYRIGIAGQLRSIQQGYSSKGLEADNVPQIEVLQWLFNNIMGIENEIKKCLDSYTNADPVGKWCKQIIGIGPVLSAALISYFDITKANSVAHFYSYAGLNDQNNPWLGKEKANTLVDKYATPGKSGYTEWEIAQTVKYVKIAVDYYYNPDNGAPSELTESDIEDIGEYLAGSEDKIKNFKIVKSIADQHKMEHNKDELTEREMNLITVDACHTRSFSTIRKMALDEDKQKYSKKKLKASLAKPPYNTELKKLLFLVGESFVKVSGKPNSLYGSIYSERKVSEIQKNERKDFANQAARILKDKNFSKSTDAYKAYSEGMLPPAHIQARSKRKAVQVFISHLFDEMYINHYNSMPPRHYVEVYMEHVDMIKPEVPYTAIDPSKPQLKPSNPVQVY